MLTGLSISAIILTFCSDATRRALTQWWCGSLLKCFNIKVNVFGSQPTKQTESTMFIANHISWSDIHAINSVIPVRFIAKLEIKSWPIFGYLVSKSGTLFINRSIRKDAARIVDITAESLQSQDNVCLFPEGTTTEGTEILPFKSSIIQAAIKAEASLWPILVYYPKPDGSPNIKMAFAGETTMVESMRDILNIRNPEVSLHFLSPINCKGQNRQAASKLAFEAINQQFNAVMNKASVSHAAK